MALPIGFSYCGWLGGVILVPIIGYVMLYCTFLMLEQVDKRKLDPINISEYVVFIIGEKFRIYITILLFLL